MARLDAIAAALTAANDAAATEAAQVAAGFQVLRDQITALQASVDQLTADTVTQAEIDAVSAQAEGLTATIDAIDTEGEVVVPPVA